MSVQITSRLFTDLLGVTSGLYTAGVGDVTTCKYTIQSSIFYESNPDIQFSFDFTNKVITISGGNWATEGFKVGDTVRYIVLDPNDGVKLDNNGSPHDVTTTVTSVTATKLGLSVLKPSINNQDTFRIATQNIYRNELQLFVNHAIAPALSTASHIDGQDTILKYSGLSGVTVGVVTPLVQLDNLGGQFKISTPTVKVVSKATELMVLEISFKIIQSGIYDKLLFSGSNKLNLVSAFRFNRDTANNNTGVLTTDNVQSLTRGYRSSLVPNKTVNSAPFSLTYNKDDTRTVTFETTKTFQGIGVSYIPQIDSEFKNKDLNQSNFGYTIETNTLSISTGVNEAVTPNSIISIDLFGTTVTATTVILEFNFEKNQAFIDIFDQQKTSGDRLFRMWAKFDGDNYLFFDDQLTFENQPPTLTTFDFFNLKNSDENTIDTVVVNDVIDFDIEDDCGTLARIAMDNDETINSVFIKIYAYKSATRQFDLQTFSYDLRNEALDANGQYVLGREIDLGYNLATGSVRNKANIFTDAGGTKDYQICIHYPFLIRWENWIPQAGSDAEFLTFFNGVLKIGTKDWYTYYAAAGWSIRVEIRKEKSTTYDFAFKDLIFTDYEDSGVISTTIELYRLDGTLVESLIKGETMRIKAIHQYTGTVVSKWGRITAEPKTGSPRSHLSTLYADENINNPLTLITESIDATEYIIEAFINTDLINTDLGVSITSKAYIKTS